jgi:hypothetical protein
MKVVVVLPTFFKSKDDLRFKITLRTCQEFARLKMNAVIVDASPLESIRSEMICHGTKDGQEYVRVFGQSYSGKKGAALREGSTIAYQCLNGEDGVIAFQEPEKVDMVCHWFSLGKTLQSDFDICVPKRSMASFRSSYPIEQFHSENFANLYLDALAKNIGFPSIDWTMGPMAFKASFARHWVEYKGDLWDMQLVPLVRAQRWHKAKIIVHEVDFIYPREMFEEETGSELWCEKRLFQLNFLIEHVGRALKEASMASGDHGL